MYYEEKMINGLWCWRDDPDGEWIPFTQEQLSRLVESLNEKIRRLNRSLREYR